MSSTLMREAAPSRMSAPVPRPATAPATQESDLHRLARKAGIAVQWTDAYDQPQVVQEDALRAILTALGLPCASPGDCRDSLAELDREQAVGYLPPLLTGVLHQPVALPMSSRLHGLSCRVELENGARLMLLISSDLNRPPTLPPIEVPGYHRLLVAGHILTLAIAPARCYTIADALADRGSARGWALAAQVYGLRSDSLNPARTIYGDGGIGHFGALKALAPMAAEYGAAALAMSPLHAMFAADPGRSSPYSPSSRLFLNPFLIDPAGILGEEAQAQVLAEGGSEMIAAHERLQQASLIDWQRAGAHRLTLLRRLYALFRTEQAGQGQHAHHQAAFKAFQSAGGAALHAHALYEAYSHHLAAQGVAGSCDWRQWGQAGLHPETPEMRAFAEQHAGEIDFHLFLQWRAAHQLGQAQQAARDAGMPIGLIADLAVGADNGGSQAWSHQAEIAAGLTVGAPPDRLAPQGQNWGLGAFSPLALRRTGYQGYLAMLRACFAQGGGVRIDHVLGLNRLWLVPQGLDADAGAYVGYPQQDLLRLIALESWRHRAVVIGEDLGTVPPGFDQALDTAGVAGIRVLWFQRDKTGFLPPADWSDQAIAVTTTHDLPTVAGWWSGADIAWRERLGHLDEGVAAAQEQRSQDRRQLWHSLVEQGRASGPLPEVAQALVEEVSEERHPATLEDCAIAVDAALDMVAATPSPLAVVPVEDILGLSQQPNLPGLTDPHPNWRRRLPADTPQLFAAYAARARLERLRRARGCGPKET
ncbi:4-alpha-glucanotransferase [Herbaspirillum frisingense]|uniref:4-alpha-glucanotransferase n=1 Tax=Herbaspirillum frisingense TaxID=92645 RepID=UPI0016009695|nr:4-alpha-glucanotransferase [Herbaspirillum frisingense]QNB07661.1 4-alpha-glucanotransferase [Herbaspirillum frisingense]